MLAQPRRTRDGPPSRRCSDSAVGERDEDADRNANDQGQASEEKSGERLTTVALCHAKGTCMLKLRRQDLVARAFTRISRSAVRHR